MACRQDIKTAVLSKVYTNYIEGRPTYGKIEDGLFIITSQKYTKGKSKAATLTQALHIARELRTLIVKDFGNNLEVNIIPPEFVGIPVQVRVAPTYEYIEKLFSQIDPDKRTEFVSREGFLQNPNLLERQILEELETKFIPQADFIAQQIRKETDFIIYNDFRRTFFQDQALYEQELAEDQYLRLAKKLPPPILGAKGQYKLFQEANTAETLNALTSSPQTLQNLKRTTEYTLLEQNDENLTTKSGQAYVFLKEKDAERFSFLVNKHKEFPREFTVTQKVTKFEKDKSNPLNFRSYNEYKDLVYVKTNKNKKSNLYNIIDTSTGELIAEKVRVLHLAKDVKESIASKYGLEFTPTQVFSPDRSISFALYRQKPSKAKYVAQAKKYLYDAIKFLNPEETKLKVNLNQVEELLNVFPSGMWDYINTTYSPEDSTNVNASIGLQNKIKFTLPKLGLLTEIEKITGKKLQGTTFKNYDRSGGIKKVLRVEWGEPVVIDYKTMTTKQFRKAISYYLNSTGYFKPSSEEENVRKYAEHNNIDYNELKKLVFGDFDEALDNIAYNQTGNSDDIELSKWRESIRNYDWQAVELFSKPYKDFYKRAKEKVKEKFKDKELANGISHLDYFFSGNFNWLNINFNNISGQYYNADMETESSVGVEGKVMGIANPFIMKIYSKPVPGKNFLKEQEVFNRLASILHEPFHALHALAYGTKEEVALRRAFDNLYNTDFGKEMMNQTFGSGYRGEQITYDTLYKEFTAFATQLMLFPKEWITKTDLRSNDIFEFIEKVQTLQDKTYEEIVRTQQKIGTTEKVITQEEKIKLSFLEKLYNFVVSALNKVIPLSKKFFNTIADSNFVEKTVIEDVFGEVEEKVTRVVKLPKEIQQSKEEFLSKMEELKSAILTLMQIDETMFSPQNINNFFSKPSFYQESGTVKPGVPELFESNPELANAVYEALGFKQRNQVGENSFNTVVNFDLNKIRSVSGKLGEQGATSDGIRDLLKYVGVDLTNVNTESIKAMADYLRSNPSERNKVLDLLKKEPIKLSQLPDGSYDLKDGNHRATILYYSGVESIPAIITDNTNTPRVKEEYTGPFGGAVSPTQETITSQQKQQAQQLYSQYLDSIFPDSKVKDIVYHQGKTDFEKFDLSKATESPVIYFSFYKPTGKIFGDKNKSLLVNFKNPFVEKDSLQYDSLEQPYKDKFVRDGYDAIITPNEIGVAFEPEQIHILGGKQDIEGFKEFVSREKISNKKIEEFKDLTSIPEVRGEIYFQTKNCK